MRTQSFKSHKAVCAAMKLASLSELCSWKPLASSQKEQGCPLFEDSMYQMLPKHVARYLACYRALDQAWSFLSPQRLHTYHPYHLPLVERASFVEGQKFPNPLEPNKISGLYRALWYSRTLLLGLKSRSISMPARQEPQVTGVYIQI